jgi:hypothetical protein
VSAKGKPRDNWARERRRNVGNQDVGDASSKEVG